VTPACTSKRRKKVNLFFILLISKGENIFEEKEMIFQTPTKKLIFSTGDESTASNK